MSSITSKKNMQISENMNNALSLIQVLTEKCVICNKQNFSGQECLGKGKCYLCGGCHTKASCNHNIKIILCSKGCFSCYDLYEQKNYVTHDVRACPMQKRLLRLLIWDFDRDSNKKNLVPS